MRETYGNTFSAPQKLIHGMELVNRTGQGSVDKFMSTTSGSRILPLSMMPGKYTSTSQHANSVDPVFRSTTGEDRAEYDERLIFQAALQVVFSSHSYYLYISLCHNCRWPYSKLLPRLLFANYVVGVCNCTFGSLSV